MSKYIPDGILKKNKTEEHMLEEMFESLHLINEASTWDEFWLVGQSPNASEANEIDPVFFFFSGHLLNQSEVIGSEKSISISKVYTTSFVKILGPFALQRKIINCVNEKISI